MLNKETYKHVNLFLKLISNLTNPQGSPLDPFYKQLSNERFYNYRTKKGLRFPQPFQIYLEIDYLKNTTSNSTRRFLALPALVLLDATGLS